MPSMENKMVKLKNFKYKYRHAIAIYAEFETLLKPMNEKLNESETKIRYHEISSAALCSVYTHGEPEFQSYIGLTCLTDIFNKIKEISDDFFTNKVIAFPFANNNKNDRDLRDV